MSGCQGFPVVAQNRTPCFRFHLPLIEPDVRICRIRLSDKDSCFRPQEAVRSAFQLDEPEGAAQVRFRVS